MNPMEDKDFMGQMAQFSQLEQMTNVASTLQNERAFNLIGREVSYNDKETGELKTGTVEKVSIEAGKTDPDHRRRRRASSPTAVTEVTVSHLPIDPALLSPGARRPSRPTRATVPERHGGRRRARRSATSWRAARAGVQFSGHALQRIERRGIDTGPQTLMRLQEGVARAAGQGRPRVGRPRRRHGLRRLRPQQDRHHGGRPRAHARPRLHEHRQRRHRVTAKRVPPMLRGMYSAISGLKMHQSMLDVTANDIANVNTIGYKGSRTTFTDQLAQLQSAATAPGAGVRRPQPGPDRPRRAVRLDRQPDGRRRAAGHEQRARPGRAGRGLVPHQDATARPTRDDRSTADAGPADAYTRAGNFTRNADGFLVTQNGGYLLGRPRTARPAYLKVPNGASNMTVVGHRRGHLRPRGRRRRARAPAS